MKYLLLLLILVAVPTQACFVWSKTCLPHVTAEPFPQKGYDSIMTLRTDNHVQGIHVSGPQGLHTSRNEAQPGYLHRPGRSDSP